MKKEEFNEIEKNNKMQWRSNKNHVRRRKFKKFNYLKHNPQKRPIAIAEDNIEQRKSYASAVTGNFIKALLWKQSKTNLQPTLIVKEKFQALHITKNQQKIQGKLPSRNNLATDKRKQHSKNKVKQLKNQLRKLKQSKNNEFNNNQPPIITNSKNEEVAFVDNRGQEHQNRNIIEVIQYIEQTVTIVAKYREKLKSWLNSNLI